MLVLLESCIPCKNKNPEWDTDKQVLQKEDENREICESFKSETTSFALGRNHTATKVWKKTLLTTQALGIIYAMTGTHCFSWLAQCLKNLIKEVEEGSHNLWLHTLLGKDGVWHFETKYKNQQWIYLLAWIISVHMFLELPVDQSAANSEGPFVKAVDEWN